jgi:uncharacterized membrane protein YgdD (TMEM256/DUF423 family)
MNKQFLIFASLAGVVAVIAGAMLAHFLRTRMPAAALDVYETAVRYQFYHVFALLACGILGERLHTSWIYRAGTCFIVGILLFSGSLYFISLLITAGIRVPQALGMLTPLGGLGFILGWIFLTIAVAKGTRS